MFKGENSMKITGFSAREKALMLDKKRKSGELSKEFGDQIPETVRSSISADKAAKVKKAIHGASVAAGGVGAVPLPVADALLLVPIQLTMLQSIYKIYGEKFSDKFVVNFIRVTLIPYIGKSLTNLIPGGSLVNASVAVAITEAIGWSAAASLEMGIDLTKNTEKFEGLVLETLKHKLTKKP